jgi:phage-related protein
VIRSRGILKTKRLLTVNCFLKRAMEESIFDIDLVNRPLRRDGYTQDSANGDGLNNRRESFIIVNAMLLRKTTTNPASFIARKTTVGVEFLTKNPLTRNDVCTRRARN